MITEEQPIITQAPPPQTGAETPPLGEQTATGQDPVVEKTGGGQQEPPAAPTWEQIAETFKVKDLDELRSALEKPPVEVVKEVPVEVYKEGRLSPLEKYMEDCGFNNDNLYAMVSKDPSCIRLIENVYKPVEDLKTLATANVEEFWRRWYIHKEQLPAHMAAEKARLKWEEFEDSKDGDDDNPDHQFHLLQLQKRAAELETVEKGIFERWQQKSAPPKKEETPAAPIVYSDADLKPYTAIAESYKLSVPETKFSFSFGTEADRELVSEVVKSWAQSGVPLYVPDGEGKQVPAPALESLLQQFLVHKNIESIVKTAYEAGASDANKKMEGKLGGGVPVPIAHGGGSETIDTKGLSYHEILKLQSELNAKENAQRR